MPTCAIAPLLSITTLPLVTCACACGHAPSRPMPRPHVRPFSTLPVAGLVKMDTIGDAYVVLGGLFEGADDSASDEEDFAASCAGFQSASSVIEPVPREVGPGDHPFEIPPRSQDLKPIQATSRRGSSPALKGIPVGGVSPSPATSHTDLASMGGMASISEAPPKSPAAVPSSVIPSPTPHDNAPTFGKLIQHRRAGPQADTLPPQQPKSRRLSTSGFPSRKTLPSRASTSFSTNGSGLTPQQVLQQQQHRR